MTFNFYGECQVSVIMLSVIMLIVIMLGVILLGVIKRHNKLCYA